MSVTAGPAGMAALLDEIEPELLVVRHFRRVGHRDDRTPDAGGQTVALRRHPEAKNNIICGAYPKKQDKIEFCLNTLKDGPESPDKRGLMEVAKGGTGFMQIPRNVYERIAKAYPELPSRLQDFARFALQSPDQIALGTVAQVAREANVPPSAIVRFANALGLGGFTELQNVCRERLVARSATYRERIAQLRRAGRDRSDVIPTLVAAAIADLERLRDHADPALLREARASVVRARSTLAQRRASRSRASAYALAQLEPPAPCWTVGGMLKQQAAAIATGDVLVVASFRNYSPGHRGGRRRAGRGVPVSRSPTSPSCRSRAGPRASTSATTSRNYSARWSRCCALRKRW
jgi:hypothetical protein